MNIKNRQQLLVIIAGVGFALLILDMIVFEPVKNLWAERSKELSELNNKIHQAEVLHLRATYIQSDWNRRRSMTLPSSVSAAENKMLKSFDTWSQDSRVSVTSIKPEWKRDSDDYMTVECRVDAAGRLEDLARFIYNVESAPLALKLDSVEITSHDDFGQQLTLGMQVNGLILNPQEN